MRCEDFPCCGHYEESTGEIFCSEATRTPAQRKAATMRLEASRLNAEADRITEREQGYHRAQELEHDEVRCGYGEELCGDCYVEAEDEIISTQEDMDEVRKRNYEYC